MVRVKNFQKIETLIPKYLEYKEYDENYSKNTIEGYRYELNLFMRGFYKLFKDREIRFYKGEFYIVPKGDYELVQKD